MKFSLFGLVTATLATLVPTARAWDYEGHRIVNGVALAALPKEFPAFVRLPANAERIKFLAGEPDRWRNTPDLPLTQAAGMDHYMDMEDIPAAGLDFATLPSFRYDFATQFAAARAAHAANFPPDDPKKDRDHTRKWTGFAPWTITEHFARLRSAFSYLRVFEELGTPEEIANAQANIVYLMGIMGHYVGDCSQPLHTTMHHHGWVGPNPNGYTTAYGIHQWIDGGLIAKAGIALPELLPQVEISLALPLNPRPDGRDPMFVAVMDYLIAQHQLVEPLYQLEKAGKLGAEAKPAVETKPGVDGKPAVEAKPAIEAKPVAPEGRAFVAHQLVVGGEMLASIWVTAWRTSVPDTYLRKSLTLRQAHASGVPISAPATATPK